jgi:CheY-like chemotaxis protein
MQIPTLLVVEDNPDHLELTLLTLEETGCTHQIAIARDGVEALDYLFCQGAYSQRGPNDQPELVLLDLGLPKLNGLQVLQRMRADPRTALVPVLLLTAASEQSDAILALAGGLNSYASKPLAVSVFKNKMAEVQAHWREI